MTTTQAANSPTTSFKLKVIADRSGEWSCNAMRFATYAEARAYVLDLACRWTEVRETRVVEVDDEPNYRWTGRNAERIDA
jgi:hypothetical protein